MSWRRTLTGAGLVGLLTVAGLTWFLKPEDLPKGRVAAAMRVSRGCRGNCGIVVP